MTTHSDSDLEMHSLSYYVDMLKQNTPFGLARYGDGEWRAILGTPDGKNCDGCSYTRELRDALRKVLHNNNNYEHVLLVIAYSKMGDDIAEFLKENECEIVWTMGDTFLEASLDGELWPLVAQLRRKKIIYVGPRHLRGLNSKFFRLIDYVQVPPRNAIKQRERIVSSTLQRIGDKGANVVGFSSGMHTKIFIDDIWMETGGAVTLIDFGSMWDGYFNVLSRSWMRKRKHEFQKLRRANTRGKRP